MLKINNMSWPHQPFTQFNALLKVLNGRLASRNIMTTMKVRDKGIVFEPVAGQGKRIAISRVKNIIPLKDGDPRVERKGRKYLETERVTKKQEDFFYETIQKTLDELGLDATVTLGTDTVIRQGKTKMNTPVLKSYPVEK